MSRLRNLTPEAVAFLGGAVGILLCIVGLVAFSAFAWWMQR